MLEVYIPDKSFFTLYARGYKAMRPRELNGEGTYIPFYGVVILNYKYPHHRRAYIVREASKLKHYNAVTLPNVGQPVGIIFKAKGRKIDVLRNVWWNLEKMNGEDVYKWDTLFWQRVGCLIENTHGKNTLGTKLNLELLSKRYCFEKGVKR